MALARREARAKPCKLCRAAAQRAHFVPCRGGKGDGRTDGLTWGAPQTGPAVMAISARWSAGRILSRDGFSTSGVNRRRVGKLLNCIGLSRAGQLFISGERNRAGFEPDNLSTPRAADVAAAFRTCLFFKPEGGDMPVARHHFPKSVSFGECERVEGGGIGHGVLNPLMDGQSCVRPFPTVIPGESRARARGEGREPRSSIPLQCRPPGSPSPREADASLGRG